MRPDALAAAIGCTPEAAESLAAPLCAAMWEFRIDGQARRAHFLALAAHLSAGFTRAEPNLTLEWRDLMDRWPRKFPGVAFARGFHRDERRIANLVFASRFGNGPPSSQDGWKYRPRGFLPVVGRHGYARCSGALGLDFVSHPEFVTLVPLIARAAAWRWSESSGNDIADASDVLALASVFGHDGERTDLDGLSRLVDRALTVLA